MRLGLVFFALLLGSALAWAGNVYIWKDDSGVLRLGDKPPAKKQAGVQEFSGSDPKTAAKDGSQRIELFVTEHCPYCTMAIRHLRSRGFDFTVYNIEEDKHALKRKRELSNGYRGVPFAMIYGLPVKGYSADTYDRHLAAGK